MPARLLTLSERRRSAILDIKEVLPTVDAGYPYYGVPQTMRRALKVLRLDAERETAQVDCLRKCAVALEAHGEHKLVDYINDVLTRG